MKKLQLLNGCVASIFLVILFLTMGSSPVNAADVCDKKPDLPKCSDPPTDPDPDDPCANFSAPDYAFWRDARTKGKDRMAQVAVYVAESDTGCEAKLLDIPLPEGPINDLKLTFSSVVVDEVFSGRIVWRRKIADDAYAVWKHDFIIDNGSVVGTGVPKKIMENTGATHLRIYDLDLSPDSLSLVYRLVESGDEPYYHTSSIRKVEIADCVDTICKFDQETSIYFVEDTPDTRIGLRSPVWGPMGNRIYFVENDDDFFHLKAIDGLGQNLKKLFTFVGDAEQGGIRDIASGVGHDWPIETEYIAVAIGNFFTHGCARIYTLDVANCDVDDPGSDCKLTYETAGTFPSWSKDGKLIHVSHGPTIRSLDNCKRDTIGLWDGTNLGVITKGWEPEAAGGG